MDCSLLLSFLEGKKRNVLKTSQNVKVRTAELGIVTQGLSPGGGLQKFLPKRGEDKT